MASGVDIAAGFCPPWGVPIATRPSGVTLTRYLLPVWHVAR